MRYSFGVSHFLVASSRRHTLFVISFMGQYNEDKDMKVCNAGQMDNYGLDKLAVLYSLHK